MTVGCPRESERGINQLRRSAVAAASSPLVRLSEQIQQVSRAVDDTNDFDATCDNSIQQQVVADRVIAQLSRDVWSSGPYEGVFREEPKLFFDRIEPAVRCNGIVLCHEEPVLLEIKVRPRSKPAASHRPPPRIRLLTRVLQT